MTNKKLRKTLEIYGLVGKGLCASAGAIVGFIFGGPIGAIPGIIIGTISAHYLEKAAFDATSI